MRFNTAHIDLSKLENFIRDRSRPVHINRLTRAAVLAWLEQSTQIRQYAPGITYTVGETFYHFNFSRVPKEYVNVNAGLNYSYGQFWLMLGPTPEPGAIPQNIPVNIGIGWGIIIYTARLFSDNLGLPVWSRPALDALLALNVICLWMRSPTV